MEDAATAEISRSQVWQWLHNGVSWPNGATVTRELVERIADEELAKLRRRIRGRRRPTRRSLFMEVAVADEFVEFLTLPAYDRMP